MKYTDKQIKKLLDGIFDGTITEHELPEDLYFAIADYLKSGLYKGFGTNFELAEGPDLDLLTQLRENVYMFSAAKTYQEVRTLTDMLVDTDGNILPKSTFNELGRLMYDTWNNDWGSSEYNTAIAQGTMADKWLKIEDQKELFPNLRYSTIGDACQICAPLDGLVAPVDDPIWDDIMPCNHYNCECTVLQEDEEAKETPEDRRQELYDEVTDKMDDTFKNNAGKTGSVFKEDHPFFKDIPKKDITFAENNFNLPIPEED